MVKKIRILMGNPQPNFFNYFKERGSETTISHPTGVKV
jgi:hypothetical protein